jgi:hypothetical protein
MISYADGVEMLLSERPHTVSSLIAEANRRMLFGGPASRASVLRVLNGMVKWRDAFWLKVPKKGLQYTFVYFMLDKSYDLAAVVVGAWQVKVMFSEPGKNFYLKDGFLCGGGFEFVLSSGVVRRVNSFAYPIKRVAFWLESERDGLKKVVVSAYRVAGSLGLAKKG